MYTLDIASQCDPYFDVPLSNRAANYTIKAVLDHDNKSLQASQKLTWFNNSPDTIREIRLYMYLNAFKNLESTFLNGAGSQIFGRDLSSWPKENFGWIEVDSIGDHFGNDLSANMKYIQPDDDNPKDQSVLQVRLSQPIFPGDSMVFDLLFSERLPRILVRSGWAPKNYFAFLHWFPQMGVYEQDVNNNWGWNCHQFFRGTEFFADFGVYDLEINLDQKFVVATTGCILKETLLENNRKELVIHAEDVIDFAWIAYPEFVESNDQWEDVSLRILTPPDHANLAPRFGLAVKQVLKYMQDVVGDYPYPNITVVDPPIQGLNSGFMEYPTLITVGSFYKFPKSIRSIESLAMHEFLHQYFMGIVATNEKEEAWLDEGFVTYFEDRILDDLYGPDDSYIDILGYKTGNAEFSRQEYVTLADPEEFPVSVPGWKVTNARKGIIYGKTSLVLKTLENLIGRPTMDRILKVYFNKWKFKHPKGRDFIAVANEIVNQEYGDKFGENLNWFFDQTIYDVSSCDLKVDNIDLGQNSFRATRTGELILPTEIQVNFEDGSSELLLWNNSDAFFESKFVDRAKIISVEIDPQNKIPLDLDINNNSLTLKPSKFTLFKYISKAIFWMQNSFQTISMLF